MNIIYFFENMRLLAEGLKNPIDMYREWELKQIWKALT